MVGGCFNFVGGLSAVIIPVAVGYLARHGDFRPALALISGLAVAGVLCYLFLVGRIETLSDESQPVKE